MSKAEMNWQHRFLVEVMGRQPKSVEKVHAVSHQQFRVVKVVDEEAQSKASNQMTRA